MNVSIICVKDMVKVDDDTINALIQFQTDNEPLPYTASRNDVSEFGREVFNEINSGKYGNPRAQTDDEILEKRVNLNKALVSSEASMADSVIQPLMGYAVAGILSDADKERFKTWNEYRKALEDMDVTATDIDWPAKPE